MSNLRRPGWISVLAPAIALLALTAPLRADIYVDAAAVCAPCDGTAVAPFPTIQEGIDAAASGETVQVGPGTYVENLQVSAKVVHLLATAGPAQTTIDGGGVGRVILLDDVGDSSVRGFTITGGVATYGAGIEVAGGVLPGEPTISHCYIAGNQAIQEVAGYYGDGGGIDMYAAVDAVVTDNLFEGNTSVRQGSAINVINSDFATIAFNTIVGNTGATTFGPGISVVYGGGHVLANNILAYNTGNSYTGAIDVYDAAPTVSGNLFHGNQPMDFVSSPMIALGPGNLNADPRFQDGPGGNFHIRLDSPAVDSAEAVAASGLLDLDDNPRPVDGDGDGNAVADRGAYEQLGTIARLAVTGSGLVSWTEAFVTPDAYHVYRSSRADLLAGNVGACQDDRDPILTDIFFDETETPAVGDSFVFVVGFERHSADSSLGLSSAGIDRTPGVPCP